MNEFAEWLGKKNVDTMLGDLLEEDLTTEQFRAVWTTYCILLHLEPNTWEYDNKLAEVHKYYWNFGVESYHEFDLFMGALLC